MAGKPHRQDSQRPAAAGGQQGPDHDHGQRHKAGLEERNNKAGDIKIEYESLDDATAQAGQWDAAKCAENAQGAAQDEEVIGWIGPFNSGCAAVEIPILNEAGLAMISPANTYIGLTKPGGESRAGQVLPDGRAQLRARHRGRRQAGRRLALP